MNGTAQHDPTALDHHDILLDLFTQVTQDAVLLDLKPVGVFVRTYEVDVQFSGEDTAAVDRFADVYGLGHPDRPEGYGNYDRGGRVEIAGHSVHLLVYTGKPRPTAATR